MTASELDAFLKLCGVTDGIAALSTQAISQMTRNAKEKVQNLIKAYLSRFLDPNQAFMYDHDAGNWVGMTADGYNIPLDQYLNARDTRPMGATNDPQEALNRIELGIAWDGSVCASGDELQARKVLANSRVNQSFFKRVDRTMLRYGTILGMTADQLYYTSSTFPEWLEYNYKNRQEH